MPFENIKNKKLVFTVATGRCGTAYLAEILRLVSGASSVHEPMPEYANVLRNAQKYPEQAKDFLVERKLPAIAQDKSPIYIETSHLFCKGFLEPLLELDIIPAIIWMRRDHREVASSLFRAGTIPGRTEKGLRFYLSPDDNGTLHLGNWDALHDYQLCYWYCLEMERRAREYRSKYLEQGWYWSETSIVDISCAAGIKHLLVELGLPELSWVNWLRYFNNRRNKVNPTLKSKQKIVLPDGLEELENEVRTRVGC